MTRAQVLEIVEKYKLRIPPTVFYDLKADIMNYEEEFEWCHDCKEYDQEQHCCHRWAKVIRNTVEEMKQEQEPRRGHWIKGYTFPDGAYWKCDKCNELIKVKFPMNYCNNCGADMRGVEE